MITHDTLNNKGNRAKARAVDIFLIAIYVVTQFYEKLSPGKGETDGAEADGATDIAAAIADEVAELKDKGNRLFVYHKTNINGLAYLSMKADAGQIPKPRSSVHVVPSPQEGV